MSNEKKRRGRRVYNLKEIIKRQEGSEFMQQVILFPEHLGSLRAICSKFRKSRDTVKKWYASGAPIGYDGYKFCAEYNQLQHWLVEKDKERKFAVEEEKEQNKKAKS